MLVSSHPAHLGLRSDSNIDTRAVITDLTIAFNEPQDEVRHCTLDSPRWHRVEKHLHLHTTEQNAWLMVAQLQEGKLVEDDLVITDVRIGELEPCDHDHDDHHLCEGDQTANRTTSPWERRPGGIWVARRRYMGGNHQAQVVTGVDVLFGVDAVEPRPQWKILKQPLLLPGAQPDVPLPRLTIRYFSPTSGPDEPQHPRIPLQAREDGTFKIVQVSDTHMVTGIGMCNDAIDAHGQPLPTSEADPLTVKFLGATLDLEKPDLVILAGDQLHHDIHDSQSALFKVVAPLIERRIPYAAVFGNHDDEGKYALSRG